MENYDVVGPLGEGSFGRVYKAKRLIDSLTVALKVISKRGRSQKELKGLRRECDIQRRLHHPNIIQMLDSFETDNEIVVITEFANKELYVILGKEGYLSEERVQPIVWDLVSALYYLHSHRVLHRDLKPQNILLDSNGRAKLCDFGFARNMSTGTHVLTSIKGTPLYMAPELIEEHPYDHNADLWSLGCIIYELLVGAPPFCTTSILHLVRLIKHEQIQWPSFISDDCISFLRGLLQKDPAKRMTWPEILEHPLVRGHVLVTKDNPSIPLTQPLPPSQKQEKEKQLFDLSQKSSQKAKNFASETVGEDDEEEDEGQENDVEEEPSESSDSDKYNSECEEYKSVDNSETETDSCAKKLEKCSLEKSSKTQLYGDKKLEFCSVEGKNTLENWDVLADCHPLECDEWVEFLQRTMSEVMRGEMSSLNQLNLASIIISPLKNIKATSKVTEYVAALMSLPFVVSGVDESKLTSIKNVYLEIKLVPNLMYATKLLLTVRGSETDSSSDANASPSPHLLSQTEFRDVSELSADELQAMERIFGLVCHLVYSETRFLSQFCDAVALLRITTLIQKFLTLYKRKLRIVTDLVAILTLILMSCPDNAELVEKIVLYSNAEENQIDLVGFLRHSSELLRSRTCYLIRLLANHNSDALRASWSVRFKETLEALVFDSIESVRNSAEAAVTELKQANFYEYANELT